MSATTGIWNQATAQNSLMGVRAASTSGSSSSSSSSSTSANIGANDFLTLLVTEMQHQDPTSQTDPNEYVNQLVQVNSLEQLISINQTLTGAYGSTSSSSTSTGSTPVTTNPVTAGAQSSSASPMAQAASHQPVAQLGNIASAVQSMTSNALPGSFHGAAAPAGGNLSVPTTNPAALRVAQALGGR